MYSRNNGRTRDMVFGPDLVAHQRERLRTWTEHDYVLTLAGFAPARPGGGAAVETAPAHVQRFLDALDEHPAYALAPDWGVAGWNAAYEALYPNVAQTPPEQRTHIRVGEDQPQQVALLGRGLRHVRYSAS